MQKLIPFIFIVLIITPAFADPAFSPKNGCTISSRSAHQTSKGMIFYGVMVESYDNEGLNLEKKKKALMGEKTSISAKKTKTKAELDRLRDLDSLILKATDDAKSHLIRSFWPQDEYARDKGSNEKFPTACPKMVVENGKAVLNPKSRLREPCIRHGLDLPSVPEIEALLNCFRTPDEKGSDSTIEREELKKIIPPFGDLYFASKDVNQKETTEYSEVIYSFWPHYIRGEINSHQDSSNFLGIQCMSRIKK